MKALVSFLTIALLSFLGTLSVVVMLGAYGLVRRSPLKDCDLMLCGSLFVLAQFCSLSLALGVRPTLKLLLSTLSGQGVLYYLVQLYGKSV